MNEPRCGEISEPTVPRASPSAAADEVYTTRRTPAAAAASTTLREPHTLTSNSGEVFRKQSALTPAAW